MPDDTMNEVMYKLGSIESMLKSLGNMMDKHIQDSALNHKDHEDRIQKLERASVRQHAITATVGAMGAGVFELIKVITGF